MPTMVGRPCCRDADEGFRSHYRAVASGVQAIYEPFREKHAMIRAIFSTGKSVYIEGVRRKCDGTGERFAGDSVSTTSRRDFTARATGPGPADGLGWAGGRRLSIGGRTGTLGGGPYRCRGWRAWAGGRRDVRGRPVGSPKGLPKNAPFRQEMNKGRPIRACPEL